MLSWHNSFHLVRNTVGYEWLANTHSLLSGWTAYYKSDVKMFGAKVKTAVMVSKLVPNSNKAQLFTYAVHRMVVPINGRRHFSSISG